MPDRSSATFTASSRLVVIDVVATDKNSAVIDLQRDNFVVYEDGKPQQVVSFDVHAGVLQTAPDRPSAATGLSASPQNQGPLNIVLLDALNTEVEYQVGARRQMLQFLRELPTGPTIAVFALGSSLRLLQPPTSDPTHLSTLVAKLLPARSPVLTTQQEKEEEENWILELKDAGMALPPQVIENIRQFLAETQAARDDRRIRITLDAFQQIGGAVASYPGRKNLIWLSGGFPFSFGPNDQLRDPMSVQRNYFDVVQRTAALLSSHQVAVYPIDVRGLLPITNSASTPAYVASARTEGLMNDRRIAVVDPQTTMQELAKMTGGTAFYNRNDLGVAIRQSIEQGSSYYSIGYVPQNPRWDGKFRRVEVKLLHRKASLSYRRGYYARRDGPEAAIVPPPKKIETQQATSLQVRYPGSS